MTNVKRESLPRVRIKGPGAGDVGYGRPPREHQFKPGQSGNPKGRPKGARNEATILQDVLNRKVTIRDGGRSRKIPVMEGIILRIIDDSLKGNTKSASFILNRYAAMVSGELHSSEITQDDREVLEAFARQLAAKTKDGG